MKFNHIKNVSVRAVFRETVEARFRYLLEVSSCAHVGNKVVCVVMQNPSIADEAQADKSVQFLEKLVFEKNLPEFSEISTLLIVNQFGLVQTVNFSGSECDIGNENDEYVVSALRKADVVVLAWGVSNPYEDRKSFVINELRRMPQKTVYVTNKHPSRASYEGLLSECRI